MRRLIAVLLSLLLAACASLPPAPALPPLQIAPAAFGAPLLLAQRLTVEEAPAAPDQPPAERQLDTLLQLDGERLQLVALALGQRVLTLNWDGRELAVQRHPLLPASVDAARVLRDIALVFAPVEALRAALPAGWRLEESAGERRLLLGAEQQLGVRYLQGHRLVEIDNRAERYRLRIASRPGDQ